MPENVWLLLLEAVGATVVFTQGSIFKPLRDRGPQLWQEFAHCPLCVGVWVGLALRALQLRDILVANAVAGGVTELSLAGWVVVLVGFGATTGMLALLMKRVYDFLESGSVCWDQDLEFGKEYMEDHRKDLQNIHDVSRHERDEAAHEAEMERLRRGYAGPQMVPPRKKD